MQCPNCRNEYPPMEPSCPCGYRLGDPIPDGPPASPAINPSASLTMTPTVIWSPKDKGIAVLLTVLLGPLGLCYAAPGLGLGLFATYVLFIFLIWSSLAHSFVTGESSAVGGFLALVLLGIHVAAIVLAFRKTDEYNHSLGRGARLTSPVHTILVLVSLSLVGIVAVVVGPELQLYSSARKEVAHKEQQAPLLETQSGNVWGFTVNQQRIVCGDTLDRVLASIEAAGSTLDKNPPFSEMLGRPRDNELFYVYHVNGKSVRLTMGKSSNEYPTPYRLEGIYIEY